ncbi:MAG: MHS family MFS transporter [Desulfobacteraceae bacterium]|nr:MHS family MFS transporter [Desulfobacteraceae bacterium]
MTKVQRQVLLLSSLGGLLEFYDFIIYALLASYISTIFFPSETAINSLLATFATYAVGYLARPFGGIVFGHYGDKYGRKKTFTVSILIMACATFGIGLIPSYNTIGIFAPALLVVLRILQGISIGGEIPGAITYVSEFIREKKGFATGLVFSFLISGIVVGYLVEALLLHFYSHQQIINGAWRWPFFVGGIFGLIAYYLRKKLVEIPGFVPYVTRESSIPLISVLKRQWKEVFLAIILTSFGAMTIVVLFIFLPSYLTKILNYTLGDFAWVSAAAIFISALLCVVFGWLSDRVSRIKLVLLFLIAVLVCALPIFNIYILDFGHYILAMSISAILVGLIWGNIPAILSELFDEDIRYSGIGLAYNIGFAVFGGLTPLILLTAIKYTGALNAPAYILMIASLICFICLFFLRKTCKKRLS